MSTFTDLPQELQIEIFSFLSVKHTLNILSINKSTRDQINHSETFWKTLVHNHSKGIQNNVSQNDQEEFNLELYHNKLAQLCQMRKKQLSDLKMNSHQFEYIIQKLSMVEQELRAREQMGREFSSNSTLSSGMEREFEEIKKEMEQVKKKRSEFNERIKLLTID